MVYALRVPTMSRLKLSILHLFEDRQIKEVKFQELEAQCKNYRTLGPSRRLHGAVVCVARQEKSTRTGNDEDTRAHNRSRTHASRIHPMLQKTISINC